MNVLLVEDDPLYAEFVVSAIAKCGLALKVCHVSNVADAFVFLEGKPPHTEREFPTIVVLDVKLSKENAFPVLRWLRGNGHLDKEKTRVVMLTASDRSDDRAQALQYGAMSYLIKSPSPESITNVLRRFITR
jgi:DNA-binding response OmpR family regulator